jgi:hypothetical protein
MAEGETVLPRRGVAGLTPWVGGALVAGSIAGFALVGASPSARADGGGYYSAGARATGVDFYFTNSSIPGGVRPEGGGPETDVAQTSLDKGDANAQFPYFGDVVPGAPGVVSGLFGFPVPPYPLESSSTFGSEPTSVNYPGVTLSTASRAKSTVADAVAGSGATSHSEVDEAGDGTVTATATSSSPLAVLGPEFSVREFNSTTRVSADPSGNLTRSSTLTINEISAPGLVLKLPQNSPSAYPIPMPFAIPGVPAPAPIPAPPFPVPFGGQTISEPKLGFENGFFTINVPFGGDERKYALPAQPVLDAFQAQGITLAYTAPQQSANGITGGVFSVSYTLPAPPPNQYYNGATPVTWSLGDASAVVQKQVAGAPRSAAAGTAVGPGGVLPPIAPGGALPAPGVLPAGPVGSPAGLAPVSAAAPLPVVHLTPPPRSAVGRLVSAALPAFVGSDLSRGYLVVIPIGLALLLSVFVLGAKGVGARWNS